MTSYSFCKRGAKVDMQIKITPEEMTRVAERISNYQTSLMIWHRI